MRRIVLLAVICTLPLAGIAIADPFPGNTQMVLPNANPHFACWVPNPNTTSLEWPIQSHLASYLDITVANQTGLDLAWTTVCNQAVDMRLDDRLNNPGLFGAATCTATSGGRCTSTDIFMNKNTTATYANNNGFNVDIVRRWVWCHETGHSLGLGHENGCMVDGGSIATSYSSHHISHVNSIY